MPMSMSGAAAAPTGGCPERAAGAVPVISFSAMVATHSTGGGWLRPAGRLVEVLLLVLLPHRGCAGGFPGTPGGHRGHSATRRPLGAGRESHRERLLPAGCGRPGGSGRARWPAVAARPPAMKRTASGEVITARSSPTGSRCSRRTTSRGPGPTAQRCIDDLNQALVLDNGSAEALALQSACLALQSHLDPWRSPLAAPLSRARINKALRLAPRNPRVLLLAPGRPAIGRSSSAATADRRSICCSARSRHSSAREATRAGMPAWGAADAFTDLAQDYLTRGRCRRRAQRVRAGAADRAALRVRRGSSWQQIVSGIKQNGKGVDDTRFRQDAPHSSVQDRPVRPRGDRRRSSQMVAAGRYRRGRDRPRPWRSSSLATARSR